MLFIPDFGETDQTRQWFFFSIDLILSNFVEPVGIIASAFMFLGAELGSVFML